MAEELHQSPPSSTELLDELLGSNRDAVEVPLACLGDAPAVLVRLPLLELEDQDASRGGGGVEGVEEPEQSLVTPVEVHPLRHAETHHRVERPRRGVLEYVGLGEANAVFEVGLPATPC